jgi:hypothetical protein
VNATHETCIGARSASSVNSTVDSLIVQPAVYTCVFLKMSGETAVRAVPIVEGFFQYEWNDRGGYRRR